MKKTVIEVAIIAVLVILALKMGWVENVRSYFARSIEISQQEQVIKESDGSITTIKYKNIFDLLRGK